MNREHMNFYPRCARSTGRFKVQNYVNVGGVAEKTALWTGLGADAPVGPCLVRFFLPLAGQVAHFHVEGSSGAANASSANGLRLDGYYSAGEVIVQLDPRVDTHVDMFGAAGTSFSWQIVSGETQSHPGG